MYSLVRALRFGQRLCLGPQKLRQFSLLAASRQAKDKIKLSETADNGALEDASQSKSSDKLLNSAPINNINNSPTKEGRTFDELYSLHKRLTSHDRQLLSETLTPELEAQIKDANPNRAFMLYEVG